MFTKILFDIVNNVIIIYVKGILIMVRLEQQKCLDRDDILKLYTKRLYKGGKILKSAWSMRDYLFLRLHLKLLIIGVSLV